MHAHCPKSNLFLRIETEPAKARAQVQANGIRLAFMHIHIWQKNRTYTRACASNRDRLDFMRRVSLLFGQYGFISEIKGQVFIVYRYNWLRLTRHFGIRHWAV